MLIIRDRQMTALRTARLADSLKNWSEFSRHWIPPIQDSSSGGRIERGLELALTYELERESDIARSSWTLALRRGFPDQALPAEALTYPLLLRIGPMSQVGSL